MENKELMEAMDWLRSALSIAESKPVESFDPDEREEWKEAVQRKRFLLKKLEDLHTDLNTSRN